MIYKIEKILLMNKLLINKNNFFHKTHNLDLEGFILF
jgi:hypothetical protein